MLLVSWQTQNFHWKLAKNILNLIVDNITSQMDHHTHHQKQETLSVIVQPHDDSRDSTQILSPGKLTPCSEMIDASDFRAINEPTYQTLTSVNGRMSPPGFSPNSSYATLTPLQPLPPISTMSDKFAYGHGHGKSRIFKLNNVKLWILKFLLGLGVNSPYSYDKSPSMDISPPHSYSPLPQSIYSQNGLPSPQKSMSPGYESPYGSHRDLLAATTATTRQNGASSGGQAQAASAASPASPPHSYSPLPHVYGQNGQTRQNGSNLASQNITITTSAPSPTLSAQSGSLHSPSEQQQMDKLWNGKLMESSACVSANTGHHLNGSQSTGFVQIAQHHLQQPHHQQQQQPHHHNQNNRELQIGNASPPPSNMLQRVSLKVKTFNKMSFLTCRPFRLSIKVKIMETIAIITTQRTVESFRQPLRFLLRATLRKSTRRSSRNGSALSWSVTAFHKQFLRNEFCAVLKAHSRICCVTRSHGPSWSQDAKRLGEWRSGFKSRSIRECQLCD